MEKLSCWTRPATVSQDASGSIIWITVWLQLSVYLTVVFYSEFTEWTEMVLLEGCDPVLLGWFGLIKLHAKLWCCGSDFYSCGYIWDDFSSPHGIISESWSSWTSTSTCTSVVPIVEFSLYLRCYRSELVVTVQVEFSSVRIAAEVQSLIPIDGEAKNAQEEHPHRAEEQGVELAYHRRRPELEHTHTHTHTRKHTHAHTHMHTQVSECEQHTQVQLYNPTHETRTHSNKHSHFHCTNMQLTNVHGHTHTHTHTHTHRVRDKEKIAFVSQINAAAQRLAEALSSEG